MAVSLGDAVFRRENGEFHAIYGKTPYIPPQHKISNVLRIDLDWGQFVVGRIEIVGAKNYTIYVCWNRESKYYYNNSRHVKLTTLSLFASPNGIYLDNFSQFIEGEFSAFGEKSRCLYGIKKGCLYVLTKNTEFSWQPAPCKSNVYCIGFADGAYLSIDLKLDVSAIGQLTHLCDGKGAIIGGVCKHCSKTIPVHSTALGTYKQLLANSRFAEHAPYKVPKYNTAKELPSFYAAINKSAEEIATAAPIGTKLPALCIRQACRILSLQKKLSEESRQEKYISALKNRLEIAIKSSANLRAKIATLRRQLKQAKNECPVCLDGIFTGIVYACGHYVCEKCNGTLKICPKCRHTTNMQMKIYF